MLEIAEQLKGMCNFHNVSICIRKAYFISNFPECFDRTFQRNNSFILITNRISQKNASGHFINADLIFLPFFELVPTIGTQLSKFLQQLSLNIRKKNGNEICQRYGKVWGKGNNRRLCHEWQIRCNLCWKDGIQFDAGQHNGGTQSVRSLSSLVVVVWTRFLMHRPQKWMYNSYSNGPVQCTFIRFGFFGFGLVDLFPQSF